MNSDIQKIWVSLKRNQNHTYLFNFGSSNGFFLQTNMYINFMKEGEGEKEKRRRRRR